MKKKVKKPPVFLTWMEVQRFMYHRGYSIPKPHHVNMVQLKGCSPLAFSCYIANMHHLSDDALSLMVQSPSCHDTLELWLQHNRYGIPENLLETLKQRLGFEWLLQHKVSLSKKQTILLLGTDQVDLIINHLDHLLFTSEVEAFLLKKHNLALTMAYLKAKGVIFQQNSDCFLAYDEIEVYRAYFEREQISDDICQGVITNKATDIFALMCEHHELSTSLQFVLIDEGDLKKLQIYSQHHRFDTEVVDYVTENASDEIFEFFLKNGFLDATPSEVKYERLFKEANRALLLLFIQQYPLYVTKWEITLLTSDDEELIKTYISNHALSSAAQSYLLTHGFKDTFRLSEQALTFPDWETESYLFKYGSAEQISSCILSTDEVPELSSFGEALLFKAAPREIVVEYIRKNSFPPEALAQRELILRNDSELLNVFLECCDFENELIPLFIRTASNSLVLDCLIEHINSETLTAYNNEDVAEALCERGDKLLVSHALKYCSFGEQAEIALLQNAPVDCVCAYWAEKPLSRRAEAELLRRGDMLLISDYLSKYAVAPENEIFILNMMEEKMISAYNAKHTFTSQVARDYLGI